MEPRMKRARVESNVHEEVNAVVEEIHGKVFTVTFTEFEDDYKHRYDSGVYQRGPYAFSTRDNADIFVRHALKAYALQYLYDLGDIEEWAPFLRDEDRDRDKGSLYGLSQKEFVTRLDPVKVDENVDELKTRACKAEFVDTKLTYSIDAMELDVLECPFW